MIPHHERVAALEYVLRDHRDQPLILGERDCVQIVCQVFEALGKVSPLEGVGRYKTLRGAKVQIKRKGFSDLPDALDALGLERIAPASCWPCDVVALPGKDGLSALGVAFGNGEFGAFSEGFYRVGKIALISQLDVPLTAWRVA